MQGKREKIIVALFVYNELRYLPYFIDYYQKQGCELLFLDNISTDGTYEYLVERGMNVHCLDTNDSFDLRLLQRELGRLIAKENPDWVVYAGADLYYSFDRTIRETIEDAGMFNQFRVQCILAYNTGEEPGLPLNKTYLYGTQWHNLVMISKYDKGFSLAADGILLSNSRIKNVEGIVINYGGCKPAEEREETYQRRAKAWHNGLNPSLGSHYRRERKRNWLRDKEELLYLPNTPYWKYIEKI